MSELLTLMNEADSIAITMEQAKNKIELAKQTLESCKMELDKLKEAFDEVLDRTEQAGMAKSKVKKLVEERVQSLISNGLIDLEGISPLASAKAPKAKKQKMKNEKIESDSEETKDSFQDNWEASSSESLPEITV